MAHIPDGGALIHIASAMTASARSFRNTQGLVTTTHAPPGAGRLYMWFPDAASQAKVVHFFTRQRFRIHLEEGQCVLVEAEWERLRDVALQLRRLLTQVEADDVRVLFKLDGGELTTTDFPRVHSFTQYSMVSQSNWLHELLGEQRLTAVFQPIVSAADPTRVFAREALMRGIGRNAALVYPGFILDVARACGMLTQVDHAAREAAVSALIRGELTEKLFVNISPGAAHDPAAAVDTTTRALAEAHIAPNRIVFEVTEADQTLDIDMLQRILGAYRDAGFGVALDDVGAGYSSLMLLHQLRPDYIKLDMELIRQVHRDSYKALIVQKIIEIAATLGIRTIAEGVEVEEELAWVRAHGADYVQGYLIARPSEPRFCSVRSIAPLE
jgi:EAL domain-containing protein (putative c-di-GMP-specific phosphodiesterase class I)